MMGSGSERKGPGRRPRGWAVGDISPQPAGRGSFATLEQTTMLVRVLSLLVLAALTLAHPFAHAAEILEHERYSLDNGLDVILHVDRRLPLIALNLGYHVGTMHDGEHPGLAHLVEHLMFRGTRHLDDGEYNLLLFRAAALHTNASTHVDHTAYTTLIPSNQLPLALWLESDRMAHLLPAISPAKVAEEIQTTTDEWEVRVQSERHGLARQMMWSTLFAPGHPFHPIDPTAIDRLRPEHVTVFVERYHGPANATLVLAGDLPEDVHQQIEHAFGHRSGGTPPPVSTDLVHLPTAEQRIVQPSELSTTPAVAIAWPTPGLYEPGDADADVLMATLNAGHLEAMVEQEQPDTFLAIRCRQISQLGQSLFVIAAEGTPESTPEIMLDAIDAALTRLRDRALTPEEIRRARTRFATRTLRGLQRIDARAQRIQSYVAVGRDPSWFHEDLARYDRVDADSVADFVRQQLVPQRRVVVLSPAARDDK